MAALQLNFLGDLAVIRGGQRLALPPSRKTRALLAYLALNRRAFRREHLCDLLWEVPDDPRGSLRWSLSKLRHLVDDGARQRIVADRINVRFDAADVSIDVAALNELTDGDMERCSLEQLEDAADRLTGSPLAGIDLPSFHDFGAWCVTERERAIRAQANLLAVLIRRLEDDPARALRHARTLLQIAPYDEKARARMIRILIALGRKEQAEQQYRLGMQMLKEAGATSTGELSRAWSGARPSPAGAATRPTPAIHLVGRNAEMERVAALLSTVIERRRAGMVLVSGEPGMGKSSLLEAAAALARAAGASMFQACAYQSESIRPFGLWIDALRKIEPETASTVFGQGDHANRERLFGGLSDLIANRARTQPVVLIFDDLQWTDESSAAALHYVVRTNADQPLLGVLAVRTDELTGNTPVLRAVRELRQANLLEEISLGPLPAEALHALIAMRSPLANGEHLSRACGGNPLLAIELARAETAGDSGQSLVDLMKERLARFDVDGQDVLRWAAVLAPRIDAATLARITGLDWSRVGETLETAARQSILLPSEQGLRFSHDLIASSILAVISPARRRTMHRRVAEVLEQDAVLDPERAADLAHHASQSGDPGLAARAMISAGKLCLRFFANEEALALARRGLQSVEQLPAAECVRLTLELREIMLAAAPVEDWETAAREYADLADRALDHGALSHARRGYYMASYVHWMHGHWTGAREEILQSERVARGGSDEEHIRGIAEAARCLAMLERDLTHADAMLMEAQALAARKHISHHAIPAALGMLRFHENKLAEATELFKQARAMARSSGDRLSEFQANEYLAMIEIERGRPDLARAYCGALVEIGEKLRDGSERPFAHALAGLCHYAIADETAPLDSALEDLRAADAKHRLAYTLTRAALLDVERQRPEAATARASEALAYAEALDRPTEVMLALVALARAREAAHDTAGRAKHAATLAKLEGVPVAGWARERAAALNARG